MKFTHFNEAGFAKMVDVSEKQDAVRRAVAQAVVKMQPETLQMIQKGEGKKGDVLGVAQVSGVIGAKQTWQIIPMCHPLMLSSVDINFQINKENSTILIECEVKTTGKTGVEMEAINAVSVTAMTIYDMIKAVDRWIEITDIKLMEKSGGKSGYVRREVLSI